MRSPHRNIREKSKFESLHTSIDSIYGSSYGSSIAAASCVEQSYQPAVAYRGFEEEKVIKVIYQPQLDVSKLNNQMEVFNSRIDELSKSIEQLSKMISPPIQQFQVEEMEFNDARELVVDYLKENKIASLSEIAENLKIDLCMLCDIIGELQENGLIQEKEE